MYVVFGSTGGIGSALCKRLIKHEGASLVMVGRDAAKLEQLRSELAPAGAAASMCLTADVTDSKQVRTQKNGRCSSRCLACIIVNL